MASDEERHEVAARLRRFLSKLWDERVWEHDGLQTVGRLVGTSVGENIIERLADLIDRPTCEMTREGEGFRCSACGAFHDMSGFEKWAAARERRGRK